MFTLTTMLSMTTFDRREANPKAQSFYRHRSTTGDQHARLSDGVNGLHWLSDREGVTYRAPGTGMARIIWRSDFDAKQPLVLHKTHSELSQ
jgi:hypothetical protein